MTPEYVAFVRGGIEAERHMAKIHQGVGWFILRN